MKTIIPTLILVAILSSCCDSEDGIPQTSSCIHDAILDFYDNSCESAFVDLYEFQGKAAYVFESLCCCDNFADVLNNNCEIIGQLGGFTGNTKINGVDFFEEGEFIARVWQK